MDRCQDNSTTVYTIGHSTLPLETFIERLKAFGIQRVVDVRTIPRSRHNPQFDRQALPQALRRRGIGYVHVKGLGGLRRARRDSINMGWRNASFRGYADYMQTKEFHRNLDRLIRIAGQKTIVVMCAEAMAFRCHRSLIADALTARGLEVRHIQNGRAARPHKLTPWISVKADVITYPAPASGRRADAVETPQGRETTNDRPVPIRRVRELTAGSASSD
ncbi:MAG: DUF488 family protein [Phycisphaerae bacterium]